MDETKENEIKPSGPKQLGVFGASYLYPGVPEAGDYLRQCWLISAPKNRMQMQAYSHSIRITTAVKLPYI